MRNVTSESTTDSAAPASDSPTATVPRSLMRDLAHELRDALSPVTSSLDLLRLQKFDPQATRATTERIERGLRRALALVDAFVLADECERGTLPLEHQRSRLSELVQASLSTLSDALARRCSRPTRASVEVSVDHAHTVRTLAALVQQADYLAEPESPIALEIQETAAAPTLSVHFHAGVRLGAGEEAFGSWRSPVAGAMALRTARRLMALQGGSLTLRGQGADPAEFIVGFAPAAVDDRAAAAPRRAGERAALNTGDRAVMRILIVDDSAEVRKAYRDVLITLGYLVTEAANAEEALARIDSDAPHVALIDIHLPQMNGYRLAQAIKARGSAELRLVMLSGMTMDDLTRRLSRQAGFDDCLDKMAGPAALHRLLQSQGQDTPA
jgi:CheY-like chemotaxis protein